MKAETIRISSNVTLFLALFLPTFWLVFFGLFTIAILIADQSELPFPTISYIRWVFLAIFLLFFLLIYFTIMRLKRVELSNESLFVSNYFKTYRYAFSDVEKIKSYNFSLFEVLIIHLKAKGKFGQRIPFLLKKVQLEYYLDQLGKDSINELLSSQTDK